MNEELVMQLNDACDFLYIWDSYEGLISSIRRDTESCKAKYLRIKNEKVSSAAIYLTIFFVSVIMLMFAGLISGQIGSYFLVFIAFAVIAIALVMANKYTKKLKLQPQKRADEFWNTIGSPTCVENKQKIEILQGELNKFIEDNKHVIEFLPEDYRHNTSAVEYVFSAIKNGLAGSIKEALNLYNEKLHRDRMEQSLKDMADTMQRHQTEISEHMSEIEYQNRIANTHLRNIENLTILNYLNDRVK